MKRGRGIKGLDDKSTGMEILIAEATECEEPFMRRLGRTQRRKDKGRS
jgi:hypothetical protein